LIYNTSRAFFTRKTLGRFLVVLGKKIQRGHFLLKKNKNIFVRKCTRKKYDITGQDGKKENILKSSSELTLKQKAFVDIYVGNWG